MVLPAVLQPLQDAAGLLSMAQDLSVDLPGESIQSWLPSRLYLGTTCALTYSRAACGCY